MTPTGAYIRPTESLSYHRIVTVDASGSFTTGCRRRVGPVVADGPRYTRPARVCSTCDEHADAAELVAARNMADARFPNDPDAAERYYRDMAKQQRART